MVITVRCFICHEHAVRVIMGGRDILQARCKACGANILAKVMQIQKECEAQAMRRPNRENEVTSNRIESLASRATTS